MRLKIAIPEPHVSADVLDAGLEAVTRLNEQMITSGEVPTFDRALRYGIQWRPEPPGEEHFDSADKVIKRKAGDCDDLAPYAAASLRVTGEDPGARAVVRPSGPKRWHAIVERSNGSIDDPSLRAGMAAGIPPMTPEMMAVQGAILPYMLAPPGGAVVGAYIVRPQIALRPVYGQMQARADLPWQWQTHLEHDNPTAMNYAMSALHTAPVASTALVGAISDVCHLAMAQGNYNPDHIDRLCAIADACEGVGFEDLAHTYGPENAQAATALVGSFFGKLARGLGKVARGAVSFIPGVGPIASSALDAGSALFHHHHDDSPAPGALPTHPASSPGTPRVVPAPGNYIHPGLVPYQPPEPPSSGSGRDIHIHVH